MCYWRELLDLVYFYKATHNMIHLDPSVVPFVRECARRTRISIMSSRSFVPKTCRISTFQKSFFIRTTRIWNLLTTRLDLDNVTFENFKSVLYGYYSWALAINYDPDYPRSFQSICLKSNTARFLDQDNFNLISDHFDYAMQGVHLALEIQEFYFYHTEFSH